MADMTDLEMTRLCAEAMGFDIVVPPDIVHSTSRVGKKGLQQLIPYDPLHDDAQAMALLKTLELTIQRTNTRYWQVSGLGSGGYVFSDNLNRAIVECVAKMQAAKNG